MLCDDYYDIPVHKTISSATIHYPDTVNSKGCNAQCIPSFGLIAKLFLIFNKYEYMVIGSTWESHSIVYIWIDYAVHITFGI
jgi:hypothetical protein